MAPKPLRGALAFLLSALLARPALAVEVSLPKSGNTGTGTGAQAGTVGGAQAGPGGVSAVPTLGLGLSPSLGGVAAPAPLARPEAAAVSSQLNPPAGYVGHDAAKPVVWPSSLEKVAKAMAAAKLSAKPMPPAIDAPSHSPASAGEMDAQLVGAAKEAVKPGVAPSGSALKTLYDGALPGAEDDALGSAETGKFPAVTPRASGLAAAGAGPAQSAFKMAPPAPKSGESKGWVKAALGVFAETAGAAWGDVKSAFVKPAAGPGESVLTVLPPETVAWLKTPPGDKLLVRSARGARYEALGYRMLYAAPAAAELTVTKAADEDVSVRLERGQDAEEVTALRARFASFNALIEANFAALELIAQSSSKMTVKTARAVLGHVTAMAEAYAVLGEDDENRAADALGTKLIVRSIGAQIEKEVRGLSDSDLLPPAAVALVMPIDKRALHKYLNYLHQQALEAVGKSNSASPANLTVRMGSWAKEKSVSLVDLSENPLVRDGRVVSPGFKALLAAMARSKDTPKGSLIMQDHQFWGHFKLGAHSAEIYASFLQPDEGGMIRVRYQEWGTGYDNQTRLYYVGRLLHKAGFHVEQKNGFLTAVIDKDHASQTVDEMTDTFALVVQALHATVGVDFALPMLVKGAKTSAEVGRRIDDWVDTVLGEGTLPFYVHDDHNAMVEGWKSYDAERRPRAILRAALDRNLAFLGLPAIPASERLGQRTIDRFVNEPIEAAIARGQLRVGVDGRLSRVVSYDPLASLAGHFSGSVLSGARMAEVVSSLDPSLFQYETIGSLGALTVERAQRRLDPNGWVTVYALRDPKGGQIGLARAEVHTLEPGEKPRGLSPDALFTALREQGHPVSKFEPSANPPGTGHFQRLLSEKAPSRGAFGRAFQGMAASPGHGRTLLARVTYDKAKAASGGYIFVAPYTTPDDLDAIRASKAVITTSGGLLSHAAITTREMGIPAAILPGVDWKDGVASLSSFDLGAPVRAGPLVARPAAPAAPVALLEGEVVRLDPATGVVELFPRGASTALLDAAGALERLDATGDSGPLAAWVSHRQGAALGLEQKQILLREVLSGLFSRALNDPRAVKALAHALSVIPGPDDALGRLAQETLDARFVAELADAAADLKERRGLVAESLSTESVERLWTEADRRARGLRAVAVEIGRRKADLAAFEIAAARLKEEAQERHGKLLAEDLSELQTHARLFPAATVEALPRIKSAIAKARRRGMNPDLIRKWEDQARRLESSRRADMEAAAPAALPLAAILDVDVPWVGGKAAKLGEIAAVVRAAGGEVPPGIALTVHAYRRFLKEAGIAERLEALGTDARLSPEQRSEFARRLILGAKLSAQDGVGKEILEGLAAQRLGKVFLAVRSSAVDEDGAEAAFAGAGDTHLYVDPAELLDHVKDVWASLWNPRALLYRETRGLSTANLAQAVVVQAMVDSVVSGVAFTQDPVSGSSGRVIVNGAFGLGEGVVSGRVAPDQYVLSKKSGLEILPPMVADKKLAVVRGKNGKGTVEEKMPPEWRRRRSMSPAKLKILSDVSVALERHFGYALDIEFGFDEAGKLYILQSRSVTSNGAEVQAPVPAPPQGSTMKVASAPKPQRLMFVCTGNTCRSPMAAHLAREKLSRRGRPDIEVVSRGLSVATAGEAMNPKAQALLEARGVDSTGHRAQPLTAAEIADTTLILTMTAAQAEAVVALHPAAKGKVFSLAEYAKRGGDIADPYGGDDGAYLAAATEIGDALDAFVEKVPEGRAKEPAKR